MWATFCPLLTQICTERAFFVPTEVTIGVNKYNIKNTIPPGAILVNRVLKTLFYTFRILFTFFWSSFCFHFPWLQVCIVLPFSCIIKLFVKNNTYLGSSCRQG